MYRLLQDRECENGDTLMPVILGKSRPLVPRGVKVIKPISETEKKCTALVTEIAKSFGLQSKKMKPKKIIFR